MRVTN